MKENDDLRKENAQLRTSLRQTVEQSMKMNCKFKL